MNNILKTNDNDYNLSFVKSIVIDKINIHSNFQFLEKLDFDIWRYIISQNYSRPHEICDTMLLINKYFSQLFDKCWILNKLSNKKSLIL